MESKNTDTVVSLREIAAGEVYEGEDSEPILSLDHLNDDSEREELTVEGATDTSVEKSEDPVEESVK